MKGAKNGRNVAYCFGAGAMPNEVSMYVHQIVSIHLRMCFVLCSLFSDWFTCLKHCISNFVFNTLSFAGFPFSRSFQPAKNGKRTKKCFALLVLNTKCTNVLHSRCQCTMVPWFAESIYIHFWRSKSVHIAQCLPLSMNANVLLKLSRKLGLEPVT